MIKLQFEGITLYQPRKENKLIKIKSICIIEFQFRLQMMIQISTIFSFCLGRLTCNFWKIPKLFNVHSSPSAMHISHWNWASLSMDEWKCFMTWCYYAILICPMKIGMQMTSSHGDEVEKLCTVYGNKCIVQKSGHRGKNSEHFCWGEAEQGREANTTFIYFKDLGIVWWSRKTWEMGDLHRREDEKIPMRIREAKRSLRASNSTWKELEMH